MNFWRLLNRVPQVRSGFIMLALVVAAALAEAGAELRHVVRTVVYIVDMADAHHVARAHGETFGAWRPASTLVQVAALTPASARVEIEVTAIVHG